MLIIKNGKIITMAGLNYENGYIMVENSKIVAIGETAELDGDIKDSIVVDANGKYVMPGLIDAHCHIGLIEDSMGFEGKDSNEKTESVTPHLRAIDGVNHADKAFVEARENGITTVVTGPGSANVIGGQFAALKTYGRRIEEMIIREPIAMKVAFGENPKTVHNGRNQMPMTRMATAALLREYLAKAKKYKECKDKDEGNSNGKKQLDYDMKMEVLIKVLDKEIPLKAHVHRADDILTALRIAKEFDVDITLDHCTEGYLIKDILVEECVPIIVGPLITHRGKIELRNQSLMNPGILANAGLKVAIMTDHPCVPIQFLIFCAAMAVREGMKEEDALKAITINAATAVGIQDRVGSLEVGKDADIILFDGHPFDIMSKVTTTIINGKIVFSTD